MSLLIVCPKCQSMNLPRAAPTIIKNDRGEWECATCAHAWRSAAG